MADWMRNTASIMRQHRPTEKIGPFIMMSQESNKVGMVKGKKPIDFSRHFLDCGG
jgi:hypothetical protein